VCRAGKPALGPSRRGASARARGARRGRRVLASPLRRLVLARAFEGEGDTSRAIEVFRRVWDEPLGNEALRAEAASAIRRLEPGVSLPEAPPLER